MSESIDCQKLRADINELRKKRDNLQKRIDETIDEGAEEADGAAFRRATRELDEATEQILERNKESFFEYFPPIAENAEIVDLPIEMGRDDQCLTLEDNRAIVRISDKIYFCRKNEAGEWHKVLFKVGASHNALYHRINDEYFMLRLGDYHSILCRDNGDSLEEIGALGKIREFEETATFMMDGSIISISEDFASFQRTTLEDDEETPNGSKHWQTQRVHNLPVGGSKRLEAKDGKGCYVVCEGDIHYFYYIDEKGEVKRTPLEDPYRESSYDKIDNVVNVVRVASDTIIVTIDNVDGCRGYYCYRITDSGPHYLSELRFPTSLVMGDYELYPLSDDGHFMARNNEIIGQYSPDPDRDGTFIEHPVIAPDGERLFPRPFNKHNGDYIYSLGNRVFLRISGEGWKIIQMENLGERDVKLLKRQLAKIADKAEMES